MANTYHLTAKVPKSRKIEITLPADAPVGNVNPTLDVSKQATKMSKEIVEQQYSPVNILSAIGGLWKDRDDILDPATYARELRDRAWRRNA